MAQDLETQRRLTKSFIDHNPVEVALTPHVRQSNGAGGWRKIAGDPRDPITVTLIPQSQWRGGAEPVRTAEGEVDRLDYVLVAEFGATVEEDDTFTHEGADYQVVYKYPPDGYQVKAGAIRRAG